MKQQVSWPNDLTQFIFSLFIASEEGGSSERHKQAVLDCDHDGTSITLIFSGRPLRVRATPTVRDWCVFPYLCITIRGTADRYCSLRETNRQAEIQEMVKEGIVPVGMDDAETRPYLMGKVAAMVKVGTVFVFVVPCHRLISSSFPRLSVQPGRL